MGRLNKLINGKETLGVFMVFLWPFLFLFPLIVPDLSVSLRLSVDVMYFYYPKVYLLDTISNGDFPFWSPNEAAGFPFFSSPFNQAFYPLNWLMALWYKIMGGFSYLDYQRFSVLGLSISAVFLFLLLRVLRIGFAAALFSTMTMSISFKWVGILNRLNATHSAAWMICMLLGIALLATGRKQKTSTGILLVGTTFFLLANYPYYTYQSIFLLVPFTLMFFNEEFRTLLLGPVRFDPNKFFWNVLFSVLFPILLCLPILLETLNLHKLVSGRSDATIAYSSEAPFRFVDTVSSFILPAYSDLRGYYFFGFLGLFMIAGFYMSFLFPLSQKKHSKAIIIGPILYILSISLVTYQNGIVFKFLFKTMPGFGFLRTWSRLNIVLVPLFAFVLAYSFQFWQNLLTDDAFRNPKYRSNLIKILITCLCIAVTISLLQVGIPKVETISKVWQKRLIDNELNFFSFSDSSYFLSNWLAFFLLLGLVVLLSTRKNLKTSYLAFVVLISFTSYDIGWAAAKIRSYPTSANAYRSIIDVSEMNDQAFTRKRSYVVFLSKLYSQTPYSVLHGKRWYYKSYTDFMVKSGATKGEFIVGEIKNQLKEEKDRPKELDQLLGVVDAKRIFISDHIEHLTIRSFLQNSTKTEKQKLRKLKIHHYDGDQLRLEVELLDTAHLSFIDNWDKHWHATVNDKEVEIEKLFGTFKSIKLPPGKSKVLFFYNPSPFNWLRSIPRFNEPWFLRKREQKKVLEQSQNAVINSLDNSQELNWASMIGVEEVNNTYRCTSKGWNNSVLLSKKILSKSKNFKFSFQIAEAPLHVAIGFDQSNKVRDGNSTIDYAIVLTKKGLITILEKGRYKGTFGYYRSNDHFDISKVDNTIIYRKNNNQLMKSEIEDAKNLRIKAMFLTTEGSIHNLKFTN